MDAYARNGVSEYLVWRTLERRFDWFVLAMAHWQLDQKGEARVWYDKAVEWMEKNQPKNEELRRFLTEAEELMKVEKKKG